MREPAPSFIQHNTMRTVSALSKSVPANTPHRAAPVAFMILLVTLAVTLTGCASVAAQPVKTSAPGVSTSGNATTDYNTAAGLPCNRGIPVYLRAITDDPSYTNAYVGLGDCYAGLGYFTEAVTEYNKAIAMDPTQIGLYLKRAAAQYSKGNSGSAVADVKIAQQYAPSQAPTYASIASAFDAYQDFVDAIATMTKAIDIAPYNPTYYETRAQMYLHAQESVQAFDDYKRAIKIAPSENYKASIYVAFADVYLQQQNVDGALQSIQHAITLQPNDPHLYVQSGDIHRQVGRLGEPGRGNGAIGLYQHALTLVSKGPDAIAAHEGLGNIFAQLGQTKQAVAEYQSAERLAKDVATRTRISNEIKAATTTTGQ